MSQNKRHRTPTEFGKNLKILMIKKGCNQKEMATEHLKCSTGLLSEIINGIRVPEIKFVAEIVKSLGPTKQETKVMLTNISKFAAQKEKKIIIETQYVEKIDLLIKAITVFLLHPLLLDRTDNEMNPNFSFLERAIENCYSDLDKVADTSRLVQLPPLKEADDCSTKL